MNIHTPRSVSGYLKKKFSNRAFTLIELLVVISIIGMLSSVVFASVQSARQKGTVAAGLKFASHNFRALSIDAFGIWNFDDSGVTTALDSSGNSYNATFATVGGSPVRDNSDRPTNVGSSMYFSAANNNLIATVSGKNLCNTTDIANCGGYTMSMWLRPADVNGGRYMLETGTAAGTRYHLVYFSSAGTVSCGYIGISITFPEALVVANQWQHITCSYKQVTTTTGEMSFYLNGKLIASKSLNLGFTNTSRLIERVAIGNYIGGPLGSVNAFNGRMDDVIIYNRTLTASEVGSVYALSAPKYGLAVAQ